jgi:hypothetical protein
VAPLKKELDNARDGHRGKRYTSYSLAGVGVGGLIGTALGAALSKGSVGWGIAGGLLGGAAGAALGLGAAGIVNWISKKKQKKPDVKGKA